MTSEPESTPRRRAPTIDLTATEVQPENQAYEAAQDTGAAESPQSNGSRRSTDPSFAPRRRPHLIGALAGGLFIAVVAVGLWLAGLVPAYNRPGAAGPPATDNAAINDITARLQKIEAALQGRQPEAVFGSRVAAVEGQIKSMTDTLAALNRRLDEIAVTSRQALARADAAAGAAEAARNSAQGNVQHSEFDALVNRIAALERGAKALSDELARRASTADDRVARAAIAAGALRAVVERSAPFTAELAAVKSFGVDAKAAAPLEPFAAKGVPSAAELAHELALLTPAMLKAAAPASRDGSILSRLETNARNLVRITPAGAPPGDDPAAIIARINAAAAAGDIAAVLADIARLPEPARALAQGWVQKAEARNAAIAASRRIAADALSALSTTNTQ